MKKYSWRKIRISFFTAIITSLILHLMLAVEVFIFTPKNTNFEKIELQIVEQTPKQDSQKSTIPQNNELARQVVDQDEKPLNDEIDPHAKYLSAHNQKVMKQTIAKNHGEFKNRTDKVTAPVIPKIDIRNFAPKFDVTKSVQDRMQKEQQFDRDAELFTQKIATQKSSAGADKALQHQTQPSAGGQASQTLDYIKDLDPGLETLLSTKEFVFYTYYTRIRKQLNQYWGPRVKEKLLSLYRQGRQIASTEDKITKCLITLDKTGNLAKVQVIGNSGVRELDEAAVDAFKSAAPFPNPPKGIIDKDGSIKIRWDFILEI